MPKLEPQIEFSVGTSSHELAKHLDFAVRRSCVLIPRTPLRTFQPYKFAVCEHWKRLKRSDPDLLNTLKPFVKAKWDDTAYFQA